MGEIIDYICTNNDFAYISFDFWFYSLFFNQRITIHEKEEPQ